MTGMTAHPALVIMSGPPLSGKTTLAKAIANEAAEPTSLLENDEIRSRLIDNPKFTASEHRLTHNVSWELIRLALRSRCHVVFDATNRTDRLREGAYEAGRECGVSPFVVLMMARPSTLAIRFQGAPDAHRLAFKKQGMKPYPKSDCTVPFARIESEWPLSDAVGRLVQVGLPIRLDREAVETRPLAGQAPDLRS